MSEVSLEIKEVYKDSAYGIIPQDWKLIPLYELRNKDDRYGFTGGPFGSDLKSEHYTEDGVRIIQLQNIGEGEFIDKEKIFTSEKKADSLISCNIYPDEIILAKMAPVARCCKVPNSQPRFVMCSDGIRLSVDRNRFNNEFVFQALKSKLFRDLAESKSTGTTRARIGLNDLKEIPLPIPPLPEQQKIAEILSAVDEKIEVIDEQIKQTQELKKGLMQRLLTKGIGHTKFKDSPLGEIPESWEVLRLDSISFNITDGSHFSPIPHENTGFKIATVKDMREKDFNMDTCAEILEKDFIALTRNGCLPEKGDILFSKDGTIGKTFVYDGEQEVVLLSSIAIIRLSMEKCVPDYVCQVLKSHVFYNQLEGLKSGSAIRRLVLKSIKEIKIPVCPLNEQHKIAKILYSVDDKIENQKIKKQSYQELKKGLMQKLLTGRIRVKT